MNKTVAIIFIVSLVLLSSVSMATLWTSDIKETVSFAEEDIIGENVTSVNMTNEGNEYYHMTIIGGSS